MKIELTYAIRHSTYVLYSLEPGLNEKGKAMGLPARGWKWRKGKSWRAGMWLLDWGLPDSVLEATRVAAELGIQKEDLAERLGRPIPFSGDMVRAILEGRKTQRMTDTKHTPTPWEVTPGNDGHVRAITGRTIFETRESSTERRANAAFIVRAVNNHEALVNAITAFLDGYDSANQDAVIYGLHDLRAALAKAIDQEKGESR